MVNGTVKFFNVGKGFGFIEGDDKESYFVHITNIAKGAKLYEGSRVSFTPVTAERGLKAENVDIIKDEESAEPDTDSVPEESDPSPEDSEEQEPDAEPEDE